MFVVYKAFFFPHFFQSLLKPEWKSIYKHVLDQRIYVEQ